MNRGLSFSPTLERLAVRNRDGAKPQRLRIWRDPGRAPLIRQVQTWGLTLLNRGATTRRRATIRAARPTKRALTWSSRRRQRIQDFFSILGQGLQFLFLRPPASTTCVPTLSPPFERPHKSM